jgi:hypothetical protein
MATCVLSWEDLHRTLQVGPSAQDRHPTKMAEGLSRPSATVAAHDLRMIAAPVILLDHKMKVL